MQRRVLVLAISALMVWGAVAPVMANSNPFYDVPEDHWAYDSVSRLAEAGLIEGYPDGSFGGSRLFTRYEMAMVFARILARFEAHIDAKIEEGIYFRTEDLALQVNEALEAALEALAVAIQAQSEAAEAKAVAEAALERAAQVAREVLVEQIGISPGAQDLEAVAGLAAEIAASIAADVAAEVAADVAASIAADIAADIASGVAADAVDAARRVAEEAAALVAAEIAAEAAARVAAEVAAQHLAEAAVDLSAIQQAVAESQEVALAALQAVEDAKAQIEALARAAAEARVDDSATAEAKEIAAQALRGSELARVVARNASETAKEAKELAEEARRIAETRSEEASILARMARLEASRAQRAVQQAISLAQDALAAAEAGAAEALRVAQEALDAANSANAEIDELFELLEQLGVEIADLQDRPAFALTAEAEAAIQEIAARLYAERLAALEAKADQIAAEIAALAGRAISAEEAAGIARRVVALELRRVQGTIDSIEDALRATQGDVAAIERLVENKADALAAEIDALAKEFRDELALLGVRVADLEARVETMDEEIRDIRAELDRVSVSGVNITTLERGRAPGHAKEDPRDPESDPFEVPERTTWSNLLQLRMDAIPADGVTARLGFDLLLDRGFFVEQDKSAREVLAGSKAFAEVRTDGDVEYARLGYLEKDVVASGYNRYLVTEKGLESAGNYGGYAELTFGDARHALFLLQNFDTGIYTTGVSSHFDVSDATDLTLNFVRQWNGHNSRTGVSGELVGSHEDVHYRGLVVADLEESDLVVDARFSAPLAGGSFVASYERIPEVWGDPNRRLPFSDEKLAEQADWSYLQTRVDVPVLDFTVWGQIGVENTEMSNGLFERFTRLGLYDLSLAGIGVDVMHERIVNQNDQWTYHNHLVLSTNLHDWNVAAIVHDRTLPADQERHQMLRIGGPVEFIVPIDIRAQFATSRTASPNRHMQLALEVADYRILPNVSVAAQYVTTTNAFDENEKQTWLDNAAWTDEDRVERSIEAAWEVTERLTLTAGLGAVDSSVSGRETSQEAGIKYQLDIFSGDLLLGYGYKVVRDGSGKIDGTPRNTFLAQYVRSVGGWTLSADGKYVLGGATGEAGNERDFVGQLKLAYPIYSGADFTLDGKLVSSKGLKAPEYEAHRITAGLRVTF